MYEVAVGRGFIAQHRLVGGDFGAENKLHSHPYKLEVILEGPELDALGYLMDISAIDRLLDQWVLRYKDHTLNDLPEFAGLNPSVENFARIVCHRVVEAVRGHSLSSVSCRVFEDGTAWASFKMPL